VQIKLRPAGEPRDELRPAKARPGKTVRKAGSGAAVVVPKQTTSLPSPLEGKIGEHLPR
jgi:hypothetical protein